MSNIGCGAVALWLDKRSIIILQPVGWENSRMYYAGNAIFVYAVAIFNLCVYSFRLLLYTHLPFLSSAYTTFSHFVIRTGHFTVLRMQFYPIFIRTRHLLSCVGIFACFFPTQ